MASQTRAQNASEDVGYLAELFSRTAFIRAFEAKALALTQSNPPLVDGSVHLCAGQELLPLAVMSALRDDDAVLCTYRGHGWAIAAGCRPEAVMAEICHRPSGMNGGRAGSAYMMAPDTRFIGENSIVGAGTTISCGVALASQLDGSGRIVVVSIGDGALNQGAVHEAMAFSMVRKLPLLIIVENNGWSELTPTSDMFRIDRLAQRAKGYGMSSATIDGTDPVAIRSTIAIAAEHLRKGEGPTLIECRVPRLWGHYHRDIQHYRSKQDLAEATARDPLLTLRRRLVEHGHLTEDDADAIVAREEAAVDAFTDNILAEAPPTKVPAVIVSPIAQPDPAGETAEMTYVQAVNAALRDILASDDKALLFGEDVGKSGGIFAASRNLQREFGPDRVFDTPIAENAILGTAVGASLMGYHPIAEIMWADFLFVAFDQLINQAANVRFITDGRSSAPLLIRTQQGVTPGSCAQHSRSIEAILANVPGLKVALASTAADAYSLLRAAAADPDPCIVIEARGLYQTRGTILRTKTAEPVGRARLHRSGKQLAIVSWGTMLPTVIEAAEELAAAGIDASVLDLRWLCPVDEEAVRKVVREAGGKLIVAHEATGTCGFGAELITRVHEWFDDELEVKCRRVTTPDTVMPAAASLQRVLVPGVEQIIRAARHVVGAQ